MAGDPEEPGAHGGSVVEPRRPFHGATHRLAGGVLGVGVLVADGEQLGGIDGEDVDRSATASASERCPAVAPGRIGTRRTPMASGRGASAR